LLVDNASSHIDPSRLNQENVEGHTSSRLTNVKIHYLPPNSTAHLQPMAHYKRLFCRYLIRQFDEGSGARNDRYFCLPLLIEHNYILQSVSNF